MSNLFKCTPREARDFVIDCMRAGLVPYIQGSPGIGKSSIIKAVAKKFKLHVIDHRLSTSEPTDMTGLPNFYDNGQYARFAPFAELFPLSSMPVPKDMDGWMIFFDEISSAPRSVQAAAYKIILDRMVGQHRLHPNVVIVAAGNLATDRAIVNPLSTAMQSRLIHIELEVSFNEWLEDVAIPENYDSRVIGFLAQYPEKLMDFKPDHHEKTFCCPRTWEFVHRLLKVQSSQVVTDKTAKLLTGTITSGVAMEFVQFTKVYQDLVTIQEIQADPNKCRLPTENALKWAVTTHMMEKIDDQNFKDLATYADRFSIDFRILFYRSILVRRPTLRTHPNFATHISKIAQYLT